MNSSPNLAARTAVDWRAVKRLNSRKTYLVIGLFFLIYFALGMLVDVYMYSGQYREASLSSIFAALLTFQLLPLVTLIMLGIAAISILVTFALHDQLMLLGTEYHEITPNTATSTAEKQLYNIIEEMIIAAGLRYMPKVYIIEADYMNAFASGYSEKSAMVAVTRGLMEKLTRSELQAVMAHELSHIRHNDIKLTLMASVLSNLTIMVLDILFYNAIFSRRGNDEKRNGLLAIIVILRYLLPVINILLLLYLSRTREYMADAGSVELLRDNQPLASALLKINNDHSDNQAAYNQAYQKTPHENVRREAYIFDPTQAGIQPMSSLADAFSTHPNIKDRLAALGFKYEK
jgi:heat shock protein HtpX